MGALPKFPMNGWVRVIVITAVMAFGTLVAVGLSAAMGARTVSAESAVELIRVSGIPAPMALAVDEDGKTAWVLGVDDAGRPVVGAVTTSDRATAKVWPIGFSHPPGVLCAVDVSDEYVAVAGGTELALLRKSDGEIRLVKLHSPTSVCPPEVLPSGRSTTDPEMFGVCDLKFDGLGRLWVARDCANSVLRVDAESLAQLEIDLPEEFGAADKLAFSPDGMIWATCGLSGQYDASVPAGRVSNNRLVRLDPLSGTITVVDVAASSVMPRGGADVLAVSRGAVRQVAVSSSGDVVDGGVFSAALCDDVTEITGDSHGMVVTSTTMVQQLDDAGVVTHSAVVPAHEEVPSYPPNTVPEQRVGVPVPVVPGVRDPQLLVDGSAWLVIPNYQCLGIAFAK